MARPARGELRDDLIFFPVFGNKLVDRLGRHAVNGRDEVVDTIGIHRAPKRSWASTLSPSVTATPRMLSPKRTSRISVVAWWPVAARAQEPILARDGWVAGVAGDGLSPYAHAGLYIAELAVAVRGLVQVHEVHVDRGPGQREVGLGVQVQKRFAQNV